jgi:phosphomannomutase
MAEPMISVAGIRGIVGDSLLVENFLRYVLAFGTLMEGGPIVLGGDSRLSRDMMRHLAFAGLESTGCTVFDVGLAPTPTVGFMIGELHARGGVAITASHNPAQWNAYKFFDESGSFISPDANSRLLDIARNGQFRRADYRQLGTIKSQSDAIQRHVARIVEHVAKAEIAAARLKIIVDCCNGVGGRIAKPLLEALGCEFELLDTDVNAEFSRNPEPLPENLGKLSQRVRQTGASIGFAMDPDADRLAIVDENGRAIGEDRTLAIAAFAVLEQKKGPVVINLSTSRALDDIAARFDVPLYRTPIGEAHVVKKIRACSAVIGGEGNGGVIYPAVHTGRDAATGIALVLGALAAHRCSASSLNAMFPDYVMLKTKFETAGLDIPRLFAAMRKEFQESREFCEKDGIKAIFADSWIHLRPSGTEPVIRVFAEATSREKAEELIERVKQRVLPA